MAKRVTAFYAFPSKPPSHAETIEGAIKEINKSGRVRIKPWTQVVRGGRPLITQIAEAIDAARLFLCDLTHINSNVIKG